MPKSFISGLIALAKPDIPNFAHEYSELIPCPTRPPMELMNTILPPLALRSGMNALVRAMCDVQFVLIMF